VGFADAEAGAEIGRLDEEGQAEGVDEGADDLLAGAVGELVGQGREGLPAALGAPVDVAEPEEIDGGDALLAADMLLDDLVHGHGRAEHAGADIGDIHQFEQPLQGAIFAEGSVQGGKNHIQLFNRQQAGGALLHQQLMAAGVGGKQGGQAGAMVLEFCERIFTRNPCSLLGDADGNDLVLVFVQRLDDRGGGDQGDLMLTRPAAKDDPHTQFRHAQPP